MSVRGDGWAQIDVYRGRDPVQIVLARSGIWTRGGEASARPTLRRPASQQSPVASNPSRGALVEGLNAGPAQAAGGWLAFMTACWWLRGRRNRRLLRTSYPCRCKHRSS